MRLLFKKGHIDFKNFKYISYKNMNTLWAHLASTLNYSLEVAESLSEKKQTGAERDKEMYQPFSLIKKKPYSWLADTL